LETVTGNRTTRAQLMAQMHVNSTFYKTLETGRIQKMLTRQELMAQKEQSMKNKFLKVGQDLQ